MSARSAGPPRIDTAGTELLLAEFLRRELERTGLQRFVVGLSGGVDSAVSTYLAARALGPDAVRPLLLPYRSSSPDSLSDASAVCEDLGLTAETLDISPMVDGFVSTAGEIDRLRLGNVMSRCRMIALYDRSAAHGALVLGTSNKTELMLGYGTLHGDMASALNPIGDLYKTQVYQLARDIGVPDSIVNKPPSADLWPDQRDEDELGFDYATVDRLLHLWIDERWTPQELIEDGFDEDFVRDVERRVVTHQFKRLPPVVAKVSLRSPGWDFRYPRDWRT